MPLSTPSDASLTLTTAFVDLSNDMLVLRNLGRTSDRSLASEIGPLIRPLWRSHLAPTRRTTIWPATVFCLHNGFACNACNACNALLHPSWLLLVRLGFPRRCASPARLSPPTFFDFDWLAGLHFHFRPILRGCNMASSDFRSTLAKMAFLFCPFALPLHSPDSKRFCAVKRRFLLFSTLSLRSRSDD